MTFDRLEHTLFEAKMIREASKDNSISDEERQERAGDTAMRLMGLLEGFGFGENEGVVKAAVTTMTGGEMEMLSKDLSVHLDVGDGTARVSPAGDLCVGESSSVDPFPTAFAGAQVKTA